VTGVIGSLQALETIKVIVGLHGKFFLIFISIVRKKKVKRSKTLGFWGVYSCSLSLSGNLQMNNRPC